ncbi:MAG TPA: PilZ domain-containing protein [Candidatus Angelobacter sp.]|nr:PilZ domain-containing protein [Candidatus Angelobacter sp.]
MSAIERRRHARRECELTVEVRFSGQMEPIHATVADICLGGCFISTVSPPPAGTTVLLCFGAGDDGPTIPGKTITSMPGNGMGVEFTASVDASGAEQLKALIERLDGDTTKAARVAI